MGHCATVGDPKSLLVKEAEYPRLRNGKYAGPNPRIPRRVRGHYAAYPRVSAAGAGACVYAAADSADMRCIISTHICSFSPSLVVTIPVSSSRPLSAPARVRVFVKVVGMFDCDTSGQCDRAAAAGILKTDPCDKSESLRWTLIARSSHFDGTLGDAGALW